MKQTLPIFFAWVWPLTIVLAGIGIMWWLTPQTILIKNQRAEYVPGYHCVISTQTTLEEFDEMTQWCRRHHMQYLAVKHANQSTTHQ